MGTLLTTAHRSWLFMFTRKYFCVWFRDFVRGERTICSFSRATTATVVAALLLVAAARYWAALLHPTTLKFKLPERWWVITHMVTRRCYCRTHRATAMQRKYIHWTYFSGSFKIKRSPPPWLQQYEIHLLGKNFGLVFNGLHFRCANQARQALQSYVGFE